MLDILLLIIGFLLIIIGIIGSILPALPGPPISWLGILCVYLTSWIDVNYSVLVVTGVLTLIIVVLDYVIPAKGTKYFGGSKYGIWGTNIGLIAGFFFPPFGFILGPFLGALVGELIYNSKDQKRALKAAVGSFIGFLSSIFIKLVLCFSFLILYFYLIWTNWSVINS